MHDQDKRAKPRAEISFTVRAEKPVKEGESIRVTTTELEVENISTVGILVYSKTTLPIGIETKMTLEIPGDPKPLIVKAIPIRKQRSTERKGYLYGCKMELCNLDDLTRLEHFIEMTFKFQCMFIDSDEFEACNILDNETFGLIEDNIGEHKE